MKQMQRMFAAEQNSKKLVKLYKIEIERFLKLETVTNLDLRQVVDYISVDRDGAETLFRICKKNA